MDHAYIEQHGLIEGYLRGDLAGDEEIRFEEHFHGCFECQEQLKLAHGFAKGFRTMAAEDTARQAVVGGIFAWLARRGRGAQTGLAAAMLIVALLPSMWLLIGPGRPASDAGDVVSPSVLLLSAYRDGTGEGAVIDPATSESSIVLAVDAGGDTRFDSYRVRIDDTAGTTVLHREGLRPNALEVLMISFPADFFPTGDYRLVVEGVTGDGTAVELGGYPFRVVSDSP